MSAKAVTKSKKAKVIKIPVSEVRAMDILSDRGKNFTHPGNMFFRCLAQTAVERNRRNPSRTLRPMILVDAMIHFLQGKGVRFLKLVRTASTSKKYYEELCRILTIDKIRNNLRDFVVKAIDAEYPFHDGGVALQEWEVVLDELCVKHGAPASTHATSTSISTNTIKNPVDALAPVKSRGCIAEPTCVSPSIQAYSCAGISRGIFPVEVEQMMSQHIIHQPSLYPIHQPYYAAPLSRNVSQVLNRELGDLNSFDGLGMSASAGFMFRNQRDMEAAMSIVYALRRNESIARKIQDQDTPSAYTFL